MVAFLCDFGGYMFFVFCVLLSAALGSIRLLASINYNPLASEIFNHCLPIIRKRCYYLIREIIKNVQGENLIMV